MTQRKVTINDVAEAAGVSVSTVSFVVSGKGRISSATVDRVNKTIEQLGYVPNRSASTLRGGSSGVIGLIVRDLSDPFYAEMTAGLSDALEQQGKVLFLTQSGEQGQHLQRAFESLVTRGVDGVILGGGAAQANDFAARASALSVPLICASRAATLDGVDSIRPDNALAARMATEYLIRQGHQRIAWLGGSGTSLTRAERIGGYCATLLQYGRPFRSEWIIECQHNQKAAAEATAQLVQQHPGITAIIAYNGSTALGCYFALLRSGRSVGTGALDSYYDQQMALIGFGDDPQAELTDPPLTMVASPAREIGRAAAARMLARLISPGAGPQHLIMPSQLIVRGSA